MVKKLAISILCVLLIFTGCRGEKQKNVIKRDTQITQNTNVFSCNQREKLVGEILGLVVRVKDGDTLVIKKTTGEGVDVRLYGIDAPEKNQAYGPQATGILKKLVNNKNITLKVYGTDRNKRLLAKVYLNGQDINAELIRIGAAWHYKYYDKSTDYKLYDSLEKIAKEKRLGLWNEQNPISPWKYRKTKRNMNKM